MCGRQPLRHDPGRSKPVSPPAGKEALGEGISVDEYMEEIRGK